LSVIQYAVDALQVDHIIVCGHHGCGGVKAAMDNLQFSLIDNWLRHVQDVIRDHEAELIQIRDESRRLDRLCELNVIQQVMNVAQTTIVQGAWRRGQELTVHGWVYGLEDGLLRDLGVSVDSADGLAAAIPWRD
jgi:carbonic anhydrase